MSQEEFYKSVQDFFVNLGNRIEQELNPPDSETPVKVQWVFLCKFIVDGEPAKATNVMSMDFSPVKQLMEEALSTIKTREKKVVDVDTLQEILEN